MKKKKPAAALPAHTHPWLTVGEAAAYLRVSAGFLNLRRWDDTGPRFHRIGRKILYATEDLDRWRKEQASDFVSPLSRRRRRERNHVRT